MKLVQFVSIVLNGWFVKLIHSRMKDEPFRWQTFLRTTITDYSILIRRLV